MKRRQAERGGRRAEAIAALWLQMKGWSVIGRRVRTPAGEVIWSRGAARCWRS